MRITSPYTDTETAFLPFLTDVVLISGERKNNIKYTTSIRCCMFEDVSTDPFADSDVDSNVKTLKITFPTRFWKEGILPTVGDIIEKEGSEKYRIFLVQTNNGFYDISGRSVK